MIGFETVATTGGLIIGALFGLLPLGIGLRFGKIMAGISGFIACLLAGFACGFLGGVPMMILATAVVVSYAYVNRQDPFTSRAALDEVNFEETRAEFAIRQLAALGNGTRGFMRSLLRNKTGFLGLLGILFFVVVTVFGPLFVEYEGRARLDRREPGARSLLQPPSAEFPLGLDWQGRSVLSHMVHGGQKLIVTSVQAALIATVIAVVVGSIAGLVGGFIDQILSAIANFILTIPSFPLLLVLASVLTLDSNFGLAVVFAVLNWPPLMRAVRAQVLSLRERDYVEAARALDLGMWHIISREVFPNMISYIAVNFIFTIRVAMYSIVALVFLGLVPLQEPDWSVMIYVGRQQGVLFNPEASGMILSPIIAIALFQLSLVFFTRSLEEIFNPRLRSGL
ncbi:MAG TPA: ABC transporter permease [Aggregatilineales bacterium]|jgi:peptide/nickel transport system permease protein|nr:ABC transporter permease [Aggregatilineales bacterium]